MTADGYGWAVLRAVSHRGLRQTPRGSWKRTKRSDIIWTSEGWRIIVLHFLVLRNLKA